MNWRLMIVILFLLALRTGGAARVYGQSPQTPPRNADLARQMQSAARNGQWHLPAEPTKVLGPIHFVGTAGLGVWLIETTEGNILINTGMPGSGPLVADSIRKLGFRVEDTKILLANHAHFDHVGGHAYIQNASQATVAMIDLEAELLESGGKSDFFYANDLDVMGFAPVKVTRVFRDGDVIKLGDVAITALLTAGHTRGTTTFVTNVVEGGKVYTVVFPDGTGVNAGYRVADAPSYPGIGGDYRRTFHTLEMLKPDVWLSTHLERFDFDGKFARAATVGPTVWVDPAGYRRWVAGERQKFERAVERELRASEE